MPTYSYSISQDTLNGLVDAGSLHVEIEAVTSKIVGVSTDPSGGDNLYVDFDPDVTPAEKTAVDAVVAAHTGEIVADFLDSDTGWSIAVEDRDLTSPPGSPSSDDYYIVGSPATGAWSSRENSVARWNGNNWQFQIPSAGFAAYVRDEGVVVVWDGSEWGGAFDGGVSSVFGTQFQTASSVAISTTTSTQWQTKVSLTTGTLEAGNYILLVSYGWSLDSTSSDFEARVLQGDTEIGQHHVQEPKDSSGSFGSTGTDQRHYASRHFVLSLDEDSYTYYLQHRTSQAGSESSIWDATMSLWRVS